MAAEEPVIARRHGLAVVLVHPEIPPNTGSIARLCAATLTPLHLVKPLGFSLDDRYLKRAGLDYWPYVDLRVHDGWAEFKEEARPTHAVCLSARAERSYLEIPFGEKTPLHLVFGPEAAGLPAEIRDELGDRAYRIPIFSPNVRSHNLSNAVSIVLYEGLRRLAAL